jgi:integrase
MKLTKLTAKAAAKAVADLTLPEGKTDHIEWDEDLRRFGVRLRLLASGKVLKSYVVQYRFHGRQRRLSIADETVMDAAQACEEARNVLANIQLGKDPQLEREQSHLQVSHSMHSVVAEYLELRRGELRESSFAETKRYLTGSYFRTLHAVDIGKITRRDVAGALNIIVKMNGKISAARARAALSSFYSWCMRQGRAEQNPVIGTEKPAGQDRDRVLTNLELVAIWNACRDYDDFGKIVRLLILTGQRRQEVGGLRWSELRDLDGVQPMWVLPRERSKNNTAHTLPLLGMALDIIRSIDRRAGRDLLFGSHSKTGWTAWETYKVELGRRAGVTNWTLHDIRRSVATKMADIGIAPHVVEQILNHRGGRKSGVAGVYNRSSYAREVQGAFELWHARISDLLTGERRIVYLAANAHA